MPSRVKIASVVTVIALGALAAVALASGSGGDPAAVQTQDDLSGAEGAHRDRAPDRASPRQGELVPERGAARRPPRPQQQPRPRHERRQRRHGRPAPATSRGRPRRRTTTAGATTTTTSTTTAATATTTTAFDDHGGDDNSGPGGGDDDSAAPAATAGGTAAMTTERRRPAKLPAWPVAAGAAGTFLAALAFLAGQVRDGRDPALGPAEPVAARAPREVVVRRIVRRVVIHDPAPAAAASARAAAPAPRPAPATAAPAPSAARAGARGSRAAARPADHALVVTPGRDPMEYAWWLASRASGLVALALITLSVTLGLAMAGRVSREPRLRRALLSIHEHAALAG